MWHMAHMLHVFNARFAHDGALATWAYLLETGHSAVRKVETISICALQCDYKYEYDYNYDDDDSHYYYYWNLDLRFAMRL